VTVKVLGVEELEISCLCDFPGNARRGALAVVRESIETLGQYRPLVIRRRDGKPDQILAGHTTRDALVAAGYTNARCEVLSCTDDEARRLNVIDNRSQELAAWDTDALAFQLATFDDNFVATGFSADDAAKVMFRGLPEPGDAPTDDDDQGGRWGFVGEVDSEAEQAEWLARLTAEGVRVRALIQG